MTRLAAAGQALVLLIALGLYGSSDFLSSRFRTAGLPLTTISRAEINASGPPFDVGKLNGSASHLRFALDLEFRSIDGGDYNDLFQTDDANSGLRIEVSHQTIALVAASRGNAGQPQGVVLSDRLEAGKWYRLKLSAINGGEVQAQLVGENPAVAEGIAFSGNNLRIGIGFDDKRRFSGDIRDVRITYGAVRSVNSIRIIWAVLALLGVAYTAAFLFSCRRSIHSRLGSVHAAVSTRIRSGLRATRDACRSVAHPEIVTRPDVEARRTVFCTVVAFGFVASVLWHYMGAMFYDVPAPWNTFLPQPISRFSDFYQVNSDWVRFHFGAVAYGLLYFPSTYLLVNAFSLFPTAYIGVAVFLAISCAFYLWYSYINLRSASLWATARDMLLGCFLSYPFLFLVHTANYEFFVSMFVALFFLFYQREQLRLAAFFLACAISMKVMPGVFLVLLLSDRRYRMLLPIAAWVVALSLLPLLIFKGGFLDAGARYLTNFHGSQQMYFDLMVLSEGGNNFGHSLLNGVRVLFPGLIPDVSKVLTPYAMFALTVFAFVSYLVITRETEFWRKVCLLVLCLDLLPYTSTDYKLIYIVITAYLFINKPTASRNDTYFSVLFGLLVVPKGYFTIGGVAYKTMGIVLTPVLMSTFLIWLVMTSPKRASLDIHKVS